MTTTAAAAASSGQQQEQAEEQVLWVPEIEQIKEQYRQIARKQIISPSGAAGVLDITPHEDAFPPKARCFATESMKHSLITGEHSVGKLDGETTAKASGAVCDPVRIADFAPPGSRLLIVGPPSVGKSRFALLSCIHQPFVGRPAIYLPLDYLFTAGGPPPSVTYGSLREAMKSFLMDCGESSAAAEALVDIVGAEDRSFPIVWVFDNLEVLQNRNQGALQAVVPVPPPAGAGAGDNNSVAAGNPIPTPAPTMMAASFAGSSPQQHIAAGAASPLTKHFDTFMFMSRDGLQRESFFSLFPVRDVIEWRISRWFEVEEREYCWKVIGENTASVASKASAVRRCVSMHPQLALLRGCPTTTAVLAQLATHGADLDNIKSLSEAFELLVRVIIADEKHAAGEAVDAISREAHTLVASQMSTHHTFGAEAYHRKAWFQNLVASGLLALRPDPQQQQEQEEQRGGEKTRSIRCAFKCRFVAELFAHLHVFRVASEGARGGTGNWNWSTLRWDRADRVLWTLVAGRVSSRAAQGNPRETFAFHAAAQFFLRYNEYRTERGVDVVRNAKLASKHRNHVIANLAVEVSRYVGGNLLCEEILRQHGIYNRVPSHLRWMVPLCGRFGASETLKFLQQKIKASTLTSAEMAELYIESILGGQRPGFFFELTKLCDVSFDLVTAAEFGAVAPLIFAVQDAIRTGQANSPVFIRRLRQCLAQAESRGDREIIAALMPALPHVDALMGEFAAIWGETMACMDARRRMWLHYSKLWQIHPKMPWEAAGHLAEDALVAQYFDTAGFRSSSSGSGAEPTVDPDTRETFVARCTPATAPWYFRSRITLIEGAPLTGKTAFGLQLCLSQPFPDHVCVYVDLRTLLSFARRKMAMPSNQQSTFGGGGGGGSPLEGSSQQKQNQGSSSNNNNNNQPHSHSGGKLDSGCHEKQLHDFFGNVLHSSSHLFTTAGSSQHQQHQQQQVQLPKSLSEFFQLLDLRIDARAPIMWVFDNADRLSKDADECVQALLSEVAAYSHSQQKEQAQQQQQQQPQGTNTSTNQPGASSKKNNNQSTTASASSQQQRQSGMPTNSSSRRPHDSVIILSRVMRSGARYLAKESINSALATWVIPHRDAAQDHAIISNYFHSAQGCGIPGGFVAFNAEEKAEELTVALRSHRLLKRAPHVAGCEMLLRWVCRLTVANGGIIPNLTNPFDIIEAEMRRRAHLSGFCRRSPEMVTALINTTCVAALRAFVNGYPFTVPREESNVCETVTEQDMNDMMQCDFVHAAPDVRREGYEFRVGEVELFAALSLRIGMMMTTSSASAPSSSTEDPAAVAAAAVARASAAASGEDPLGGGGDSDLRRHLSLLQWTSSFEAIWQLASASLTEEQFAECASDALEHALPFMMTTSADGTSRPVSSPTNRRGHHHHHRRGGGKKGSSSSSPSPSSSLSGIVKLAPLFLGLELSEQQPQSVGARVASICDYLRAKQLLKVDLGALCGLFCAPSILHLHLTSVSAGQYYDRARTEAIVTACGYFSNDQIVDFLVQLDTGAVSRPASGYDLSSAGAAGGFGSTGNLSDMFSSTDKLSANYSFAPRVFNKGASSPSSPAPAAPSAAATAATTAAPLPQMGSRNSSTGFTSNRIFMAQQQQQQQQQNQKPSAAAATSSETSTTTALKNKTTTTTTVLSSNVAVLTKTSTSPVTSLSAAAVGAGAGPTTAPSPKTPFSPSFATTPHSALAKLIDRVYMLTKHPEGMFASPEKRFFKVVAEQNGDKHFFLMYADDNLFAKKVKKFNISTGLSKVTDMMLAEGEKFTFVLSLAERDLKLTAGNEVMFDMWFDAMTQFVALKKENAK